MESPERENRERTRSWARLLRFDSLADLVEEIVSTCEFDLVTVELHESDEAPPLVSWRDLVGENESLALDTREIDGEPSWILTVAVRSGPVRDAADHVAARMEAWRAVRDRLRGHESRLAIRTRELDLIQVLGRRAAEARTPYDLIHAVVSVLESGDGLDAAMVAHALEGEPVIDEYFARPLTSDCRAALAERATRMLGREPSSYGEGVEVRFEVFDEAEGARSRFTEADLVVLPLSRRGRLVACLVVLPSRGAGEGHLRLVYGAANQLSLHLDRILTVLESEADRFRSILDSMPQAVLLTDGALRIVQVNRAAKEQLGSLDLPIDGDLAPALDRLDVLARVHGVRDGSEPVAEVEVSPVGGRVLVMSVSRRDGRAGGKSGLVFVLSDVTERRRLQQQLAQSEKMSSLGQMISGIAHELNNPLTSILGYSQMLQARAPDSMAERLEVLQRESRRCQRIVQNLLSFARRRETERKRLSLNQVVTGVLSLIGYQLRVDDVAVRTELCSDLPAMWGDAHELQQVLVNLLTNAHQAIRRSGEAGEILIRTWHSDGQVFLEVEDNGPGVPDEVRGRIFDPFFTTKEEGQGTGLGLSLVFGIVVGHGGSIELAPHGRPGARFRVLLPVERSEPSSAAEACEQRPVLHRRPGRLLVVDDEEPLARMLCDALEQDGHATCSVRDGREALDLLSRSKFDLVISDLKMPGMGGERLYEEIRRTGSHPCDRLLLTTGDTASDEPDEVGRRTGLEILHKPFDLDRLRDVVRAKLGR